MYDWNFLTLLQLYDELPEGSLQDPSEITSYGYSNVMTSNKHDRVMPLDDEGILFLMLGKQYLRIIFHDHPTQHSELASDLEDHPF